MPQSPGYLVRQELQRDSTAWRVIRMHPDTWTGISTGISMTVGMTFSSVHPLGLVHVDAIVEEARAGQTNSASLTSDDTELHKHPYVLSSAFPTTACSMPEVVDCLYRHPWLHGLPPAGCVGLVPPRSQDKGMPPTRLETSQGNLVVTRCGEGLTGHRSARRHFRNNAPQQGGLP